MKQKTWSFLEFFINQMSWMQLKSDQLRRLRNGPWVQVRSLVGSCKGYEELCLVDKGL